MDNKDMSEGLIELMNRAQAYENAGRLDDAVNAYRTWLEVNDSAVAYAAYFNLAVLLFKTEQIGLAQAALRACLLCNPGFEQARVLCIGPTLDAQRPMCARVSYGHTRLKMAWLGHSDVFRSGPVRDAIAGTSATAAEHVVFAWGPDIPPGAMDVNGWSDEAVACKLRTLRVDVLLDLMAWNANCRPGIVAYHPAPWVVAWTENPKPSGLEAVDAVMGDLETLPQQNEVNFQEVVLRLEIDGPGSPSAGESLLAKIEALLAQAVTQLPLRPSAPTPPAQDLAYLTPPQTRGRRYVIVAPPFQHASAGIRVLYELQKWLVLAGYDALVCTWFTGYPIASFADDIVIYPEVAPGNLLQARRVVRYILNTPGKLGSGEKTYGKEELLVAYNNELAPFADGLVLQVPATEPFFYNAEGSRDKNAFYVGKGRDLQVHPVDCVEISKKFPETRSQLADFLRTVHTFYTYDDFTMLAHEAKICGCKVVLIDASGKMGSLLMSYMPSLDEFRAQLNQFIEITQKL